MNSEFYLLYLTRAFRKFEIMDICNAGDAFIIIMNSYQHKQIFKAGAYPWVS